MLLRKIALTLNFKFMKQTTNHKPLNLLSKIVVVFILLATISGCSDELRPELKDPKVTDYSFKKINLMELQKINSKAFIESTKLQKVATDKNKSKGSSLNYDLDLQNIQYTVRSNKDETFSFRLYQDPTATFQQNIVVDCKKNKIPQTYLITYYLNKQINQINNSTDFVNAIKSTNTVKIDNLAKTNKTNDTGGCLQVGYYEEADYCAGNLDTRPKCYNTDGSKRTIQVFKIIDSACSTGGVSGFTPLAAQWDYNTTPKTNYNPESGLYNGNPSADDGNELNIFVPNYFEGYDLSDPQVQSRLQINQFINSLYVSNNDIKNIIDTTEWLLAFTNYWIDSSGGLTSSNKNALTFALTNLSVVIDQFSTNDYSAVNMANFKLSAYQFLLKHGEKLTQLNTQTQQSILRICTTFENIEFADETIQYQIDNNWSQESTEFSQQLINSMLNNDNYSSDGFMGDTDDDNNNYSGPKQLIPSSIILNDGSTLSITFGTTQSDQKNSNNEVATDLVNSIIFAINLANSKLDNSNKIQSLYIAATTNGSHSPTSNHKRGTAVDISRINGIKMITLGSNIQVKVLQEAFDNYVKIRENFGPYFKHKTYPNGSVNLNWPIGGHQDHIHVSVQSY
jgi:hypothetical protein